jgi:small subunit ribosomal protein S2
LPNISIENLLSAGAHFGHMTSSWNPNMRDFIFTQKNGVHIIDLNQTLSQLSKAIELVDQAVKNGGSVLFVGTKKTAKQVIVEEANRCNMFHVTERWLGGTLTNFITIKKSIKRLQQLEKEGIEGLKFALTKKEMLMRTREKNRLEVQHRGIKEMRRLPNVIVVVDAKKEAIAVQEAKRLEIPVICMVDTNSDPRNIEIPIPANDDSIQTIRLIVSTLADTILEAKGVSGNKED